MTAAAYPRSVKRGNAEAAALRDLLARQIEPELYSNRIRELVGDIALVEIVGPKWIEEDDGHRIGAFSARVTQKKPDGRPLTAVFPIDATWSVGPDGAPQIQSAQIDTSSYDAMRFGAVR
ncbi:MAG TPA: hypothetical protein VG841_02080 [Caulobacterales bacterium]|nr:hypothetical protein [Caulobacterales bacterium]